MIFKDWEKGNTYVENIAKRFFDFYGNQIIDRFG